MRQIPFESFTYPFFDFNYSADHNKVAEAFLAVPDPRPAKAATGLYLHIPFCDTICSFCPFNKSVGTEARVRDYVDAISREAVVIGRTERARAMSVDAVYVGGGTPSVLTIPQIETVIRAARSNFCIADDAEVTFEFEAKSITREKLKAVKDLGVNRVSFGVQTIDPVLRGYVNLTATLGQIEDAINWSRELFEATNFDLMVGFPGQTCESANRDIEWAVKSGISSVSVYPVDYVVTIPKFIERIARNEIPQPAPAVERHAMFQAARRELRKRFHEQNIYCYGRRGTEPCRYMFQVLYGSYEHQYLGLGCGAYSSLKGLMWQNLPTEEGYVATIRRGQKAVSVTSPYHAYEKGLVFFPKRLSYDLQELDELGMLDIFQDRIQLAIDAGLVTRTGSRLALTEAGQDDYAALMVDFFSDVQRRLYNRICRKLSTRVGWAETSTGLQLAPTRTAKKWGGITSMTPSSTM